MPDDKAVDEEKAVAEIVARLQERFPDKVHAEILVAVDHARAELATAKVRDFLHVLIEKDAKKRLKGNR